VILIRLQVTNVVNAGHFENCIVKDLSAISDEMVSCILLLHLLVLFGSALVKGVKVDSMWKFDVCAQFYKLVQRVNMFVWRCLWSVIL
jgi:hypothetical protein